MGIVTFCQFLLVGVDFDMSFVQKGKKNYESEQLYN